MGGRLKPASSLRDSARAAPVPPGGELEAIPALAPSLLARPSSKRALDESSDLLFAKGSASTSRWRSYDHKDVFAPAQGAVAPPSDADLAGSWHKYDGPVAAAPDEAKTVSEEDLPTSWYKYETKPLASLLETTRSRSKAPIYLAETAPPASDQPAQPETPPAANALDAAGPQAHPQPSEPVAVAETPVVPAEPPAPEMVRALEPVPASEAERASVPTAQAIEEAPEAPPPVPPSAPETSPASPAKPSDEAEIRTAELPAPSLDPVATPQALEPSDSLPIEAPPPPMMEAEPAPVTPMQDPPVLVVHAEPDPLTPIEAPPVLVAHADPAPVTPIEAPPVLVAHAEPASVTPLPVEALARSEAPGEPIPSEPPSTEGVGALSAEADLSPARIDAPAVEALATPAPSEQLPRSEEPIQPIPAEPPSVMIPKFVGELRNRNRTGFSKIVARLSLKFVSGFQGRDTGSEAEGVLNPEVEFQAATIDPPAVEALETAPPPSWPSEPETPSSTSPSAAGRTDASETRGAEPATPPVEPSAKVVEAQGEPAPTHSDAAVEPEVLAPAVADDPPQEPALELGVETEAAAPAPESTTEAAPSLHPGDERELSQMAASAIKSRGPANKAMLTQLADLLERALSAKRSARDAEPPIAPEPEASAPPSRETERSPDAVASEPSLPPEPETASLKLPPPPEATEPAAPEILMPAVPLAKAAIPREDIVEKELTPVLPLAAVPEVVASEPLLPPEPETASLELPPPLAATEPAVPDIVVPAVSSAEAAIPREDTVEAELTPAVTLEAEPMCDAPLLGESESSRAHDAVLASEPLLSPEPERASLELPPPPEATEPLAPEIPVTAVSRTEAAIPREDTVEAELAAAVTSETEPESDTPPPQESESSRAHDAPQSVAAEVLSKKPDPIDQGVPQAPSAEDAVPIAAGAVEPATEQVNKPEPEHAASIEAAPVQENLGAAPAAESFAEEPDVAGASIENEKSPQEALADDLAGMIHEVLSTRKFATTALKPGRYSSVAPRTQAAEEPEPAELEDAGELAADELPHPAAIRPRLSRMERAVAFVCAGMMIVVGYFALSMWRNESVSAQAPMVVAAPASKASAGSTRGVSRDLGAAATAQRSNSSSLELGQ